jgi:predicted NUDIX family phosphoesterase
MIGAMSESSILCIERNLLETSDQWDRVRTKDLKPLYRLIKEHGAFYPREKSEDDQTLLQVIPWIVVQRYNRLWVMQRVLDGQEEPRLTDLWKVGVRGHIEEPEGFSAPDVVAWGTRKLWTATVETDRPCRAHLAGALLDNENEVGHFHLGLIFFVGMKFGLPKIRPELQLVGSFKRIEALRERPAELDTWSKWMLDALASGKLTESLPEDRLVFHANRYPTDEDD